MYNIASCLQLLRNIRSVSFASVDKEGNPHNRMIDVMLVENEKLYFLTARGKSFYNQITNNPKVAIVGLSQDYQTVRLKGIATKLNDQKKWIDKMFRANKSMNEIYPGESRYILDAFVVENGEVEIFDLSVSPIFRQSFQLGSEKVSSKGFFITEECIQCGVCAKKCPQQTIIKGIPYRINQEHCLHCGLCYEVCPVKAIRKTI
ncbi:MAG: 4Fe-4S binding protein [Bacteroidales bacterium]